MEKSWETSMFQWMLGIRVSKHLGFHFVHTHNKDYAALGYIFRSPMYVGKPQMTCSLSSDTIVRNMR